MADLLAGIPDSPEYTLIMGTKGVGLHGADERLAEILKDKFNIDTTKMGAYKPFAFALNMGTKRRKDAQLRNVNNTTNRACVLDVTYEEFGLNMSHV